LTFDRKQKKNKIEKNVLNIKIYSDFKLKKTQFTIDKNKKES